MQKNKILLIYPDMGMSGAMVCHMPLSLLYAAIDSLKSGFHVEIVDVRLISGNWQEILRPYISSETILIGFSVMTGTPISSSLEICRWIRKEFDYVPIVWGGPHALFNGAEILSERTVDYAISGNGSLPLARLAKFLRGDGDSLPLEKISGLVYRSSRTSSVISVPPVASFELISFREIPYCLIEKDLHLYGQLESSEIIFSMYSTLGCPYSCAFCSSPAQYRRIKQKYLLLPVIEVVDHIEFVHNKYGATYIYFIDDDSFVELAHVEAIIDEIAHRQIPVKLGFRGARINEILNMDNKYLAKLSAAGTTILHIGAESGSQRMLDLMKKNITVGDILEVNRKLAGHPEILAAYNFIIGLPGETIDDLEASRRLVLRLLEENSRAIIFAPNKYRPLPGTELYEEAFRYGYNPPATLEEWTKIEVESDFRFPWYSDKFAKMVDMMQMTSYFIDDKLHKVTTGNSFKFHIARFFGSLYAPLARFRYRHGVTFMLIEYWLFRFMVSRLKN